MDRIREIFERYRCESGTLDLDEERQELMIRDLSQLLSERRKETLQEIFEWNELQIKRWEKEGFNKDFRNGVQSGYGWSNQHIEHLITRKECKCPI